MADLGARKVALLASDTEAAHAAAEELRTLHPFVQPADAEMIIALGGDGFMLQTLHAMLDDDTIKPVFGMNLGTIGFLMNQWRVRGLGKRIDRARAITVNPLRVTITTGGGDTITLPAINEISLLRETRQAAKIEITINDRVMLADLTCDGVLVATPAGSTAYNLSAYGPILPLDSALLALTPISPFRPRRWRGAILPDRTEVGFRVLEPDKRPVSAVADSLEIRRVARVEVRERRDVGLTMLFEAGRSFEERVLSEQFTG